MNSVFQCLDQSVGHAFRWDSWKGLLKERFGEIEPWLMPAGRLAANVPCERTQLFNCSYRVVEHANGTFAGVCDEGRCQRRVFEKSELVL
jgi:hypothetical protein